jgi:hypothetical protein
VNEQLGRGRGFASRHLAEGVGRRRLVKTAGAIFGALLLAGHTPYGQWTIYRRRNLFIVASRTDKRAVQLAQMIAEKLAEELPESRARYTRANDTVRVASLLATEQLDVAVISADEAVRIFTGSGEFRATGPVPLRLLAELNQHVVTTTETFSEKHAYVLAQALEHIGPKLGFPLWRDQKSGIPEHPGAILYRETRDAQRR